LPRNPNQLYDTQEQKADLEARNGLLQFDEIRKLVAASRSEFKLTPDILLKLQYLAIHDIYNCAGRFRTGPVYLSRAVNDPGLHQPGPWEKVASLVDEMCDYVNTNFGKSAVHLSAYVMWRQNWIHPFFGGNGRTSRAASYLVLCARLGYDLPGSPTVPQQIADVPKSRDRYFRALQSADASDKSGRLDVSAMEELVSDCLAAQLLSVHQQAGAPSLSPPA
jgi:fido (protein-threonine AMPylation protein)